MLLGGRVFNNNLNWIVHAIKEAYVKAKVYWKEKALSSFPDIKILVYQRDELETVRRILDLSKEKEDLTTGVKRKEPPN